MLPETLNLWQESIIEEMTPFSYPEDPDDWDSEAFENLTAQRASTKNKNKGENS